MSPVQQWSDGQLHGHLRALDPEGEQLSYSVLVAPEYGSLELDQQGFYKYTPDTPAESGSAVQDSFVLAVSDPPGGSHLINGDTGTAPVTSTLQNFSGAHVTADGSAECVNGKDCSGKDLAGADLSGQNLAGVKFVGTNLTFTNLTGATLVSADFTRAILTGTKLADSDLTRAILPAANLGGKTLVGAVVAGADLTGAILTGADLSGKVLTGTVLTRADLTAANLTDAILTGAKLNGAQLAGVTGVVWSNTVCSNGISKSIDCRVTLIQGQSLSPGDTLASHNTVYSLVLQADGNLVVYRYDAAKDRRTSVWSTKTDGKPVTSARLQDDGNFVLYTAAGAVWESFTSGTTGTVTLFVENNGDLVMYQNDLLLWTTGCKAKGTPRGQQSITCAADVA